MAISVSAYSYDLFAIFQVYCTLSLRCKIPNHTRCVLACCHCWMPRHMLAVCRRHGMGQQSVVVQCKSSRLYFADSIGTDLKLTQAAKPSSSLPNLASCQSCETCILCKCTLHMDLLTCSGLSSSCNDDCFPWSAS